MRRIAWTPRDPERGPAASAKKRAGPRHFAHLGPSDYAARVRGIHVLASLARRRVAGMTEVIRVDPIAPDPAAIARTAACLRGGGLAALPTETVYGLGVKALDPAAVARVFEAKGRPTSNPLIVHVAGAAQARELVVEWPERAERLTARFWPGPLSIVLPKRPCVPAIVTGGGPTVALRAPRHAVMQAVLRAAETPIAAPSANRSLAVSPTRAEHVLAGLDGRIDLVLDAGPCEQGLESTVVDLSGERPRVLRLGAVLPSQLAEALGCEIEQPTLTFASAGHGALPSPGALRRHYAPRAIVELAEDCGQGRVAALSQQGAHVGWLALDGVEPSDALGQVVTIAMPRDAAAYAARLYAALHELDNAGVERIIAARLPDGEPWLAIRDRLWRAAAER